MLNRLHPGVSDLNDQIAIDRREALNSFRGIQKFRDYAMGIQDTTLTVDQQKMLEGVLGNDYCDNVCGQIVSEHSDRLELKRVTSKDDNTQKWIDKYWQRLKLDDLQTRVHRNTIRDGNFCVMVEYDFTRQKIAIHREKWWDGNTGVFIGYDVYGEMLYAVKEWQTPNGRRRTVYYEGAVERYINQGGGSAWLPILLPSDMSSNVIGGQETNGNFSSGVQTNGTEPFAIPREDINGKPLAIPFIHFQNPGDEFENYGVSILSGGCLGAQDQINDAQYDISAAARMTGYQRTWSKGYKLEKDKRQKSKPPKTGPGVHYHAEEPEAAWGSIQAGDISQLLSVYKMKVEAFCRMTGTPYASITGNWPSGEAIYKLEQPIRGRTKARQNRMAPAWVEVIHRCIELANAFDQEGLDEEAMLTAEYVDAGDRDPMALAMADLSMWQAAEAAVSAGVPLATFLKVQGWGEDQLKGLSTDIAVQIEQQKAQLAATENANVPAPTPRRTGGGGGKPSFNQARSKPAYKAAA